jgi:serine protease AprX
LNRILFGSWKILLAVVAFSFLAANTNEFADVCRGFLPENSLRIPVPSDFKIKSGTASGLTEAQFTSVLDRLEAMATPIVKARGGKLVLSRRWTDGSVNASAQQAGSLWLINMYGGLARYPNMTEDSFLFVACHELGHHLGGAPKAAPFLGVKNWATVEGGADYYASLKCLREIFANDDNERVVANLDIDPLAQSACQSQFSTANDVAICLRTSEAAIVLGGVMKSILDQSGRQPIPTPSLATPDMSQVSKTSEDHPTPQCRLDTSFAGSTCETDWKEPNSETDPDQGACAMASKFGARPRCWFAPSAATPKVTGEDVIVWFSQKADLAAASLETDRTVRTRKIFNELVSQALISQEDVLKFLRSRGVAHRSFHIANAIHIENASQDLIRYLQSQPGVQRVAQNFKSQLKLPAKSVASSVTKGEVGGRAVEPGVVDSGAEEAWKKFGTKGAGIVVASADSGVEWTHPALKKKYRGGDSFIVNHNYHWHDAIHSKGSTTCPSDSSVPCDDSSHGSHTVGTMVGGEGSNEIGIAPEAKWIGCRNMNQGVGTLATYLECFEFLLAPYPFGGDPKVDGHAELAPHIINNSWSCPTSEGCRREDLIDVVRVMKAAGIAVVVAAGNDGDACGSLQDPPGTYSGDVISVGAYNRYRNEIASFSSRGPSGFHGGVGIDITAQGVGVRSAVLNGKYDDKDGTSMAAPHVAGAIALLWSYRPELIGRVDETVDLLKATAKPMTTTQSCGSFAGGKIPNTSYGYGMLDIVKLLDESGKVKATL